MRLLLIEDNHRLSEYVSTALRRQGFAVDAFACGAEGEAALATTSYDTLILDLGLPDMDGLTVLAEMRKRRDTTPVLILTARDAVEDLVIGLNSGADDYLRKPFEVDELIARVRALLRRPETSLDVELRQGNLILNVSTREVRVDGVLLDLGRRECGALELLMRRADRVVTKAAIEEAVYGFGEELASNAIEVLIHRLRRRMSDAGANAAIHTLRGVGYMLSITQAPS